MLEKLQKLLDRIESRIALWSIIGGSSVVGIITGWIASYSTWVSQFGAIGWVLTGLISAMIAAIIFFFVSIGILALEKSRARKKWVNEVDSINPLDAEFNSQRILLTDIRDPIENAIKGKTFNSCDLIGPANILLLGGSFHGVQFVSCDVIPLKNDAVIHNAVKMESCIMNGGRMANATIYSPQGSIPDFQKMGVKFIAHIKDEAD